MRRKRLTLLFAAMLCYAALAAGATNYGVYVGGVQLTSSNYQNINIGQYTGTITFDPATATLTLSDVTINQNAEGIRVESSYYKRIRVKLMGVNTINGISYGLHVKEGVSLQIEGPGTLIAGMTSMNYSPVRIEDNSSLTLRDGGLSAFNIAGIHTSSDSGAYRGLTFINSSVNVTTKITGITYITNVYSRFEDKNVDFKNGKVVNLTTGAEVSNVKIIATPAGDFDGSGTQGISDAQHIVFYQTGDETDDNPSRLDLNQDGDVNVADVTMLYNYIGGTRTAPSNSFLLMHELVSDSYAFGNMERQILYNGSNITQKWVWTELFTGDVVDTNSLHFTCHSSNPTIVEPSIVSATVDGNLSTKAFQLTIKRPGIVNVSFGYDDGKGNSIEATALYSVYGPNQVLATGDKIFGARLNGSTVESFNLNTKSNVPVGTVMRLTIDKDATYSYDADTRKARVTCTTWKVTGNDKVWLTKTDAGYVEVEVGAAGEFTVTATDPRGMERTATFRAKDVYTYDRHSVYENNSAIFHVPEAKTSQIFGRATKVEIKKMIINNGEVWTLVNHYRFAIDQRTELFGSLMSGQYYHHDQEYEVPITTQIFRNGTLFYEKENTFFEDLAVNANTVCGVGTTYNPDIDYYDWGYDFKDYLTNGWGYNWYWDDLMSKRLSMFYVTLNKETQSENYSMVNPGQTEGESIFRNVIFDPTTNDILLFGYYKSRHTYRTFTNKANFFQRNWVFWRLNQFGNHEKELHFRDQNDHYSYMPYAIAMAKGKPRGASHLRYFETDKVEWLEDAPGYDLICKSDIIISDFSKTNGSGTVDMGEIYVPNDSQSGFTYRQNLDGGITSSWYNGSLYGWKKNKVYKFADDCKSFETFRTYEGFGNITQLKVLNNTAGVSGVEEFFVLAKKSNGMTLNSMFGDMVFPNFSLVGFDFK